MDLVDILKWVKKNGIEDMAIQPISQFFPPEKFWFDNELWPKTKEDIEAICGSLKELLKLKREGFPLSNSEEHILAMIEYFKNMNMWWTTGELPIEEISDFSKENCKVAYTSLNIDFEGNIKICGLMGSIGNINVISPGEAWESERAKIVRKKILICNKPCKILNCNVMHKDENLL